MDKTTLMEDWAIDNLPLSYATNPMRWIRSGVIGEFFKLPYMNTGKIQNSKALELWIFLKERI